MNNEQLFAAARFTRPTYIEDLDRRSKRWHDRCVARGLDPELERERSIRRRIEEQKKRTGEQLPRRSWLARFLDALR